MSDETKGGQTVPLEPVVGPDDDPVYCPDCQGLDDECVCDVRDEDDGEDEEFACGRYDQSAPGGMWPAGMCRLAGTEECDFECPHR